MRLGLLSEIRQYGDCSVYPILIQSDSPRTTRGKVKYLEGRCVRLLIPKASTKPRQVADSEPVGLFIISSYGTGSFAAKSVAWLRRSHPSSFEIFSELVVPCTGLNHSSFRVKESHDMIHLGGCTFKSSHSVALFRPTNRGFHLTLGSDIASVIKDH